MIGKAFSEIETKRRKKNEEKNVWCLSGNCNVCVYDV